MTTSRVVQLPLEIQLKQESNFESFWVGDNASVFETMKMMVEGFNSPQAFHETNYFLWGAEGVGKTHLLQAVCNRAAELDIDCAYLPLAELLSYGPEVLQGLETMRLVCLDDIHQIIGRREWQVAIFHLFNKLRDQGYSLVVSSDQAAMHIPLELADLKSRLSWGLTFKLDPLSEQGARELLIDQSLKRGLQMSEEVADYIISRDRRSAPELLETLDKLDFASLSAKRKLTRPFVKEVLGW